MPVTPYIPAGGGEAGFEAGFRVACNEEVCSGVEDCKSKNILLELGKIYEVRLRINPPVTDKTRVYDAIRAVRSRYPGVSINYLWISGDGGEIIVQLFDPPYTLIAPIIELIVVIALIIMALVATKYVIEDMAVFARTITPPIPGAPPTPGAQQPPEEKTPGGIKGVLDKYFSEVFWYTITLSIGAVAAGYFIRGFKRKK